MDAILSLHSGHHYELSSPQQPPVAYVKDTHFRSQLVVVGTCVRDRGLDTVCVYESA